MTEKQHKEQNSAEQTDKPQSPLKNINSDRHAHEHVVTDDKTFESNEEEYGAGTTEGEKRTKDGTWSKRGRLVDF